jgi:Glycosyl hydrolase family 99
MSTPSRRTTRALAIGGAALALCAIPVLGLGWGRVHVPSAGQLAARAPAASRGPVAARSAARAPVFAYYYIWINGAYWSRGTLDSPVRPFPGDYSSDNPAVIRWQVRQAKAAGITGLIVCWRDTPAFRKILSLVERAANRAGLKLAMQYESLNASGQPVPVAQVAAAYRYFAATYARNQVWYRIGGKPLTMWYGTRLFSRAAVASVTGPVRRKILVLSTGNNVAEFDRLAAYTDGDAYYWSSVNPALDLFYRGKLAAMGSAVHHAHKIWLAPFAPGFNDTLVGGHRVVPRNNGATLRTEFAAALASRPDVLGLISWNEWAENTYVEPSLKYRHFYLKVLTRLGGRAP